MAFYSQRDTHISNSYNKGSVFFYCAKCERDKHVEFAVVCSVDLNHCCVVNSVKTETCLIYSCAQTRMNLCDHFAHI